MKDLGTLGGTFSEAHGISRNSDVVGVSTTANNAVQKAFLWQSGLGLQDLNTLIDSASGWTLMEAQAISEDGTYITGVGMVNGERNSAESSPSSTFTTTCVSPRTQWPHAWLASLMPLATVLQPCRSSLRHQ